MKAPIMLLGGLSGAGKTTLAKQLAGGDFLWVDLDPPEGGHDLLGKHSLKSEFKAFWNGNPEPLANELRSRLANVKGKHVTLITFASTVVFSSEHIVTARKAGIVVVLLWATPPERCSAEFVTRQMHDVPGSDEAHWVEKWTQNNRKAIEAYSAPEFPPALLNVFRADGARRAVEELADDVRWRLGLSVPKKALNDVDVEPSEHRGERAENESEG